MRIHILGICGTFMGGIELTLATGNVTITADANIDPTKVELALDTGEVSAITWSEIIPGVTMVWTPIDTN